MEHPKRVYFIKDEEVAGLTLRKIREERKLTQEEVAKKIGISPHTVYSIENGVRLPSLRLVSEYSQAFGVQFLIGQYRGSAKQG